MALMAFYEIERAVTYEYHVCKMRSQEREPRLSNYSILPRDDEIPSTIHGFVADSGMVTRSMNREQDSDLDAKFGRLVLRQAAELTNADIAALSLGVNNLVILAQRQVGLNRDKFLHGVFCNWNTSYIPPRYPPKLPNEIVSNASIRTDCYSHSERTQAKAACKLPSEMGIPERPAAQKAGAEVLIKVRPGIIAPSLGFVNRNGGFGMEDNIALHAGTFGDFLRMALRSFDHTDGAICRN
ncbi:hypothetical protein BPOR_0544g00080 [Botrytis porri]|uniref:Uncharacterized protein n=2 Tax=Botrytis porri TaxID=87229 RepID=A0A4Z1KDD1_9HELO|nr:hypothetical protein BPOR_0544g00080 [Botrytis porri]